MARSGERRSAWGWVVVDDRNEVPAVEQLRLVAEHASDVVYQTTSDGTIAWMSPNVQRVLGWDRDALVGTSSVDLIAPQDRPDPADIADGSGGDDTLVVREIRYLTVDGERRWMRARTQPVMADGLILGAVTALTDVQDEVVARRAAQTLSLGNGVLARATSEAELLEAMCAAAVTMGCYQLAWYGRPVDDEVRSVEVIARKGAHSHHLDDVEITWGDAPSGRGPTGRALRTGHTVSIGDYLADSAASGWRALALRNGFRSSISVPVFVHGQLDGVFAAYAPETHAFDDATVAVLENLGTQIGIGIERVRDVERLAAFERQRVLLMTAFEQTSEAIVVTDTTPSIVYANPSALRASGRSAADVLGRDPSVFASGVHDDAFFASMWATLHAGRTWRGILVNRRASGESYEDDTTITPVRDGGGHVIAYVSVRRDLSVERRLEADLGRAYDEREAMVHIMGQVRPAETLEATVASFAEALLHLDDIDIAFVLLAGHDGRFISIGQKAPLSHVAVNGALLELADVGLDAPGVFDLSTVDRVADGNRSDLADDVAQVSELSRVSDDLAALMIEDLATSCALTPVRWEGSVVAVIVTATRSSTGPQLLRSRAGLLAELGSYAGALFGAEVSRRNVGDARRAQVEEIVAARRFHPVFQPVIDLTTGAVCGYEALTRFDDGVRPDLRFIEAHTCGVGVQLEAACARAAIEAARDLPAGLWLSLNFSPAAVLGGEVADIVAATDRPTAIEITEHTRISDYRAVLDAVRACGPVSLSVDDAGAGYASLRHILELQPDTVKLDVALVRGIDTDPARQALVAGMCHFTSRTGTTLLAEGVETQPEADTLAELGVQLVQGYLFGRPAPVNLQQALVV
jgi:PAS domain S-box-containing protein